MSFSHLAYVPKYRCAVKECETVNATTYYGQELLPFDADKEINMNFPKFVELGIGMVDASLSLEAIGKTCKKINLMKQDLTPPVVQPNINGSCEEFQNRITRYIHKSY